ncbi:MAG: DUF167 domain-containing protein [Phycisphaerales bacterium]|nr:DUF167 domain-containing protein [Phycisphaerales bacterium]
MGNPEVELKAVPGGVSLAVQVVPGASRTRVVGAHGTALKVAVAAPPEGGKANDEVVEVLAALFGRRRGDVRLVRGQTQRLKAFQVAGITLAAARAALDQVG